VVVPDDANQYRNPYGDGGPKGEAEKTEQASDDGSA
jgi:hypothetical protein